MIHPTTYVRKPFTVQAIRVTENDMYQISLWCEGEVKNMGEHDGRFGPFIEVKVLNPQRDRQKQAFAGDWILKSDQGFKVYTNAAFEKSFDSASAHAQAMGEIIRNEASSLIDKALVQAGENIQSTFGVVVSPR